MKQEEHETVDQFVVRLSNQAANCEFGAKKNEQIRDQIIDKCKSTERFSSALSFKDLIM